MPFKRISFKEHHHHDDHEDVIHDIEEGSTEDEEHHKNHSEKSQTISNELAELGKNANELENSKIGEKVGTLNDALHSLFEKSGINKNLEFLYRILH